VGSLVTVIRANTTLDLADFSDLEVRLVDLDSIVASAMRPKPESITIAETRSLRDTRSKSSVAPTIDPQTNSPNV